MGTLSYSFTLTNGTTADASQVQGNFDAVKAVLNGNVDADNLANLSVTSAKVAADLNGSKLLASSLPFTANAAQGGLRLAGIASYTQNEQVTQNSNGSPLGSSTFTAYGRTVYAAIFGGYRLENAAGSGASLGWQYSVDGGAYTSAGVVNNAHLTGALNMHVNLGALSAGSHTVAWRAYQGNTPYVVSFEGAGIAVVLEAA